MATIAIDSKYRLGVDALDAEHAQLISLAEELKTELEREGKVDSEKLPVVVDQLIQYTKTHFDHEEQLMSENQYPGLSAHQKKHSELKRQVEEFAIGINTRKAKVALQINMFMTIWLFEHITKDDADFARHYKARHQGQ